MNTNTPEIRKVGRPPVGEKPMTSVEQKRRSRKKLNAEGSQEFLVRVGGTNLTLIKKMCEADGSTPSAAIYDLLQLGISQFCLNVAKLRHADSIGAPLEAVQAETMISTTLASRPELVEIIKGMLEIK